jgi:acetyl-CoA C-acetyltransferase
MADVWVLGGAQTDFARNDAREGREISDLVADGVHATLTAAGVEPGDVEAIHVGNAFGELFTGQAHLGAMPATVEPALWGVPASRHEAACASGGIAILSAMADIEAGRYDCVLVLGVEQERNVSGGEAARHLGAAAWVGHEADAVTFVWPAMFSEIGDEYDRRYGLDEEHLGAIAELNFRNARTNPVAQTRDWTFSADAFARDDATNPVVEGRIRRTDCSQVTDGAAGVVLASDRFVARRGSGTRARIAGWGHRTVGLPYAAKIDRSRDEPYVFPHVRRVIEDAFGRAGVAGVDELDGIETHDCFTTSEYMAIDHFGITAPGRAWEAIERGDLERTGRMPVNPSGGLIGGGHPVGATGVRMLVDAAHQVTGLAGAQQVDGAATFGTLNIGGSTATAVSLVVRGEDR